MNRQIFLNLLLISALVQVVPSFASDDLLTGGSGPLRVQVDLARGGALDGLWLDADGDGLFTDAERWVDSPDRSDLIFITRRVPVDSLYEPLGVYLPGRSFPQTAIVDTAFTGEDKDGWRAIIDGHFGWAGRWPYRLVWQIPAEGRYLRLSMELGGDVRLIGASPSQGPFAHIEVSDMIQAWGIGLRLRYADRESFHLRTFAARVDGQLVRVPAEELRWSRWANERWFRRQPQGAVDLSPWPDFNHASLIQTGAGKRGARVWKAVEPTVGHLTVSRGERCGGWSAVGDRKRGLGILMPGLGAGETGEMRAELDYGDRTGLVNCYFQAPGMRPADPFVHHNRFFGRPRQLIIVPFAGRLEDAGLESIFERLPGRVKGGAD
jgi:hypothetical protein